MTVVERPAKSDPGGDQARHLLTRFISTPGSSDTRRRKGGPSGIEGKIYHRLKPRSGTVRRSRGKAPARDRATSRSDSG